MGETSSVTDLTYPTLRQAVNAYKPSELRFNGCTAASRWLKQT